ncbi:hypothetical protein BC567DRAFT_246567 [Phyllosticta citribraziliensis]
MAYSKRQIVTALSVVYLLILTVLACYAHTSVQRYSLPLSSWISGLLIITPFLTGIIVDRLTRIRPTSHTSALTISPSASYGTFPGPDNDRGGGGGGVPRAVLQLLPRHHLRTQLSALGLTVFLTAMASLASPVYDMAWPFARHAGGVTERSRCRQMYGRETSCYGVWEEEERRTAGIVIGVTAGVWLWKMLVLFTPRHRPSWLSTHRTPPPAPPPRAIQQNAPFFPRALTTAPHTSPPPPTPETSSGAANFSATRNIAPNANKPPTDDSADNSSVTPTNNNFLAKSPSRNIPKRERNRPSRLNIPYHTATPDAGYANSPGPEVGDLETSSLYRDTSDSEAGDSKRGVRYDELSSSEDEHELFVNGVPSPALPPRPGAGGVEDATPRGESPVLAQYHLRLANAAANKKGGANNSNSNSSSGTSGDRRPSASSQFGVQHYRRSPTAFKFPMSPLSTRSENTTNTSTSASAQSSRPQSRGDGQPDTSGDSGHGDAVNGDNAAADLDASSGNNSSSGDDSVQTAVAIDDNNAAPAVPVLKPSPRRAVPAPGGGGAAAAAAAGGGRRLSPRPRSRHAVLNGSTGIPKLAAGGGGNALNGAAGAGHKKSFSNGGAGTFGYGAGGGGGGKPHTTVPAVLITEVGDDDDDAFDDGRVGEGGEQRPASRERVLVRAGGGGVDE